MNAVSRLFAAKHPGRCPYCKRRIVEGQLIVRLKKPVTWVARKRLIPRGGGRFFIDQLTSQHAHGDCQEEYNER